MNVKELEAKVNSQEAAITAMGGALQNMQAVIDDLRKAFTVELLEAAKANTEVDAKVAEVHAMVENQGAALAALSETLEDVKAKVEGRNRSSAVKRNMTDEDAVEVLTGKFKDMGHKAAAEAIGLTYAQVYSCRLEFTMKHVHKTLREEHGFKNPWRK